MSVLIFVDQADGVVKKASLEAVCYGANVAETLGTKAEAVVLGNSTVDLTELGKFGAQKVYHIDNELLNDFDAGVYTNVLGQVVKETGATLIIFSHNVDGKSIAPRLSAKLKAGLVSGAIALPETRNGFTVRKNVFSGKAFANVSLNTEVKIISLNPNSYKVSEGEGKAEVQKMSVQVDAPRVKVTAINKITGEIPLTEAERVVSGGRGLKGPENWPILEDLAKALNAATACSRPVADSHWRPHHEHVGQTGFAIAPDLYIALGISGAIQHLAGVNRSKVIVVINKDAEAPFFKAADYGIVGDVFEVVPQITQAVKKLRGI